MDDDDDKVDGIEILVTHAIPVTIVGKRNDAVTKITRTKCSTRGSFDNTRRKLQQVMMRRRIIVFMVTK